MNTNQKEQAIIEAICQIPPEEWSYTQTAVPKLGKQLHTYKAKMGKVSVKVELQGDVTVYYVDGVTITGYNGSFESTADAIDEMVQGINPERDTQLEAIYNKTVTWEQTKIQFPEDNKTDNQ
jgi:hypothetical protein